MCRSYGSWTITPQMRDNRGHYLQRQQWWVVHSRQRHGQQSFAAIQTGSMCDTSYTGSSVDSELVLTGRRGSVNQPRETCYQLSRIQRWWMHTWLKRLLPVGLWKLVPSTNKVGYASAILGSFPNHTSHGSGDLIVAPKRCQEPSNYPLPFLKSCGKPWWRTSLTGP